MNQATPIRGPICPDSIAAFIQAISASAPERFFNGVVRILAKHAFFPRRIHALLDVSEIESTERCEGCGKVSKEKGPELRLRKVRRRLPLAMRFVTDVPDVTLAREVLEQAVTILGCHAMIASLAVDRGFMDGQFLWWLNRNDIVFYISAKASMNVYKDALSLVEQGILQNSQKKRTVGRGQNKTTVIDRWEAVCIESLTSEGFYGERGSGSHENRKDFVPNPISAAVVLHDPYLENHPNSDPLVILPNGPVEKPLRVYEGYDERSEIDNGLSREAKQGWFIERPARNHVDAFRSHVYLTLITMALTEVFRTWMEQQDEREKQGEETGIRKFREKVKQENGNKLIVFDEDLYAIFDTYEVLILCGRNVLKPKGVPEVISKEDILKKYGVLRE